MRHFDRIISAAAKRKGGLTSLERLLSKPAPASKLRKVPGDRWLSEMTRCVFEAGFNWRVIESKWTNFEQAFDGFDIRRWAMMSPDDLDDLMKADGIVRNAAKIRSVGENAAYLLRLAAEHGSAGAYFAGWKTADYCENVRALQKEGSRLGGVTGQRFLRRMGVSALIFTPDVLKALACEGVVRKAPSSKAEWASLQAAIDQWSAESGRSLTEISQILAFSVDRERAGQP